MRGGILGEVPEEIEGTLAMTEVGGSADSFGDEVLGAAYRFDRGVAEDEETEKRGGEGAAGAVGRGGLNVFSDETVNFAGGETEYVGRLGVVAGGGDDVKVRMAASECVGGGFGLGKGFNG